VRDHEDAVETPSYDRDRGDYHEGQPCSGRHSPNEGGLFDF
jgi:hypothetical protein